MDEKLDVIVIGGGLAGLSTASHLGDLGNKVVVVEQRPYLGGRAASFSYKDRELDIGQHVFLRCFIEYQRFLRTIGAWDEEKVYMQPSLRLEIFSDGRRGVLRSAPLPSPFHLLPSLLRFPHLSWGSKLRVLYGVLRFLKTDRHAPSLEHETLYDFLRRHAQTEEAMRNLWNLLILPALNTDLRQVSARWGLMVFQEALLKAHAADVGYGLVGLSRMLEGIFPYLEERGGRIFLGKAVKRFVIETGQVRGVQLENGDLMTASRCVSAVPPDILLKLLPDGWRRHPFFARARELRWAPIVNVHLLYDRPVVRLPIAAFLESPVQWVFLKESASGQHLCISLSGAWEYIDRPSDELVWLFREELERLLPSASRARLLDGFTVKQRNATFIPAPGCEQYRLPQRTPVPNLFLAGDWTKTGWPATMEGAVRSGILCAKALLDAGGVGDPRGS